MYNCEVAYKWHEFGTRIDHSQRSERPGTQQQRNKEEEETEGSDKAQGKNGQQTGEDAPHPTVVESSGGTRRPTRNRTATKRFKPEIDGLCDAKRNSLKAAEPAGREEEESEEEHNSGKEDDKAESKVSEATCRMAETLPCLKVTRAEKSEMETNSTAKEGTAPRTGVGVPRSRARKEEPPSVVMITVEEFRKEQRRQHGLAQIIEYLENNVLPSDRLSQIGVLELAPAYTMDEFDMLCKATAGNVREDGMQWVVPEKLRGQIVQPTHSGHGHAKALRTYQMIKKKFYWPGMYTDVHRFVKACPQCTLNSEIRSVTPMTEHPMTDAPGKIWIVDLLTHG